MFKYGQILIFLCFLQSQHINYETGWEFYTSPDQSYYIFDNIQIDGESAIGDGWFPTSSNLSDCIDNPNTCDVLGAFKDDVCVGWVYADSQGYTTLPIMGVISDDEIDTLIHSGTYYLSCLMTLSQYEKVKKTLNTAKMLTFGA